MQSKKSKWIKRSGQNCLFPGGIRDCVRAGIVGFILGCFHWSFLRAASGAPDLHPQLRARGIYGSLIRLLQMFGFGLV